jgi:uncharacterized membrane protein
MIILILTVVLFVLLVAIGDERGVASMFTILGNMLLMLLCFYLIAHGNNPYLVTAVCALLFLLLTLFAQNGANPKTAASFLSVLIVSCAVTGFSTWVIHAGSLGGFGELYIYDEEISFLNSEIGISANALLICSILLGVLGALTDTALAVSSALYEVHANNPSLDFRELYRSGGRVGRDILGTTINTLLFAEFGESFFIWMIFLRQGYTLPQLLNSRSLLQEVLLIFAANIGCLLIIPLTAAVTSGQLKPSRQEKPAGDA